MSELREKLMYKPKHGYDRLTAEEVQEMEAYSKAYRTFLDNGKTERECVEYAVKRAQAAGFTQWEKSRNYKAGEKIYYVNRNWPFPIVYFLAQVGGPMICGAGLQAVPIGQQE